MTGQPATTNPSKQSGVYPGGIELAKEDGILCQLDRLHEIAASLGDSLSRMDSVLDPIMGSAHPIAETNEKGDSDVPMLQSLHSLECKLSDCVRRLETTGQRISL